MTTHGLQGGCKLGVGHVHFIVVVVESNEFELVPQRCTNARVLIVGLHQKRPHLLLGRFGQASQLLMLGYVSAFVGRHIAVLWLIVSTQPGVRGGRKTGTLTFRSKTMTVGSVTTFFGI